MATDNYEYQIKQLPRNKKYGGDAVTDGLQYLQPPDTYVPAAIIPADSPYSGIDDTGTGGGGGSGVSYGSVTVSLIGDIPGGSDAEWQIGNASGVGNSTVPCISGEYNCIFLPYIHTDGNLYEAAPKTGVVVPVDGNVQIEGEYKRVSRLQLSPASDSDADPADYFDLNTTDIPNKGGPVKMREYYVAINGVLKEASFFSSLPKDVSP